jgi:dUTP pyrophosphatase
MQLKAGLKVKFLSEEAKSVGLPYSRYEGDAGDDLHVILDEDDRKEGLTIFPGERRIIPTGIALSIEPGFWARIVHRSSTEKKLRLRIVEGTIDQGYQGPIFVQVANETSYPIKLTHKDRIAQLILMPIIQRSYQEVQEFEPSHRGQKGFGSSGK